MKSPTMLVPLCVLFAWIGFLSSVSGAPAGSSVAPGVLRVGTIASPEIVESSGLVASRTFPGIFWTHNDTQDQNKLFAITRQGRSIGRFQIAGTAIKDLEDIAIDNAGNLFIADTGNNNGNRNVVAVHQIKEPNPRVPGAVPVLQTWKLKFSGKPVDCEGLVVWNGFGFLVGKETKNGTVPLFRFSLAPTGQTLTLQKVGQLKVKGDVSGAGLSADGRRLALITTAGACVFTVNGNLLLTSQLTPWLTRLENDQTEGACFAGDGLLVSAESREIYLFNHSLFRVR